MVVPFAERQAGVVGLGGVLAGFALTRREGTKSRGIKPEETKLRSEFWQADPLEPLAHLPECWIGGYERCL